MELKEFLSNDRLTGVGVDDTNIPQQPESVLTQKQLAKLIGKGKGHKTRAGFTSNTLSKDQIKKKRKLERSRKKKNR